jgi:hypothetical protein
VLISKTPFRGTQGKKIPLLWKCYKETPYISILSKQKCQFFFFTKSENSRAEQVLPEGLNQWEVEEVEKGRGRVNMGQILCTLVCE